MGMQIIVKAARIDIRSILRDELFRPPVSGLFVLVFLIGLPRPVFRMEQQARVLTHHFPCRIRVARGISSGTHPLLFGCLSSESR